MEPPIGSVIAFAGDLPSGFEASTGWMLCDGRLLDGNDPQFQPLFNVIRFAWGGDPDHNRFNIPDLLGRFLRGVEPEQLGSRDPDGDQRTPTQSGGHGGRAVGSFEDYATAMPREVFRVEPDGTHTHGLDFEINASRDVGEEGNTVANPAPAGPPPKFTNPAGNHTHVIRGGDRETRPRNCYVHWIIRFI
jgi:hypothetical protein